MVLPIWSGGFTQTLFGNCHCMNVVLLPLVLLSPGFQLQLKPIPETWLGQGHLQGLGEKTWAYYSTASSILIITPESLLLPHSWLISLRAIGHVLKLLNVLVCSTPKHLLNQRGGKLRCLKTATEHWFVFLPPLRTLSPLHHSLSSECFSLKLRWRMVKEKRRVRN